MQTFNRWQTSIEKEQTNIEDILEKLLKARGFKTKKQRQEFLNPKHPSDFSFKELDISHEQMQIALEVLKKIGTDKILVYGDYDADGITATAILWECLYKLGFNVLPFIPSRFEDGYGINIATLKKVINENEDLKLIITVDNGIVANQAVEFANKNNVQVIVTDHHKKGDDLPKAKSIIHTTLTSGSAIAWFFSCQIESEFSDHNNLSDNTLELAAIGTVADQLPLVGFNRSIVKYGLEKMRDTKREGLQSLMEISSIQKENLGTYDINFKIAPRINASGRISTGMDGLRLLCTGSFDKSRKLSKVLDDTNKQRQDLVNNLYTLAEKKINDDKIIIVEHEEFHEGVIGLIASRIVEKHYRPTIIMSIEGEIAKASARSIKGFSMVDAINEFRHLIIEGGGHDMAAGFSIKRENINEFRQSINSHFEKLLTGDIMSPSLEIDSRLDFSLINWDLLKQLNQFEPFGIGNKRPVFITYNCQLKEVKAIGNDKSHIKFSAQRGANSLEAIYFKRGYLLKELTDKQEFDLVYQLNSNEWNGKSNIQLVIKDVRRSSKGTV